MGLEHPRNLATAMQCLDVRIQCLAQLGIAQHLRIDHRSDPQRVGLLAELRTVRLAM